MQPRHHPGHIVHIYIYTTPFPSLNYSHIYSQLRDGRYNPKSGLHTTAFGVSSFLRCSSPYIVIDKYILLKSTVNIKHFSHQLISSWFSPSCVWEHKKNWIGGRVCGWGSRVGVGVIPSLLPFPLLPLPFLFLFLGHWWRCPSVDRPGPLSLMH